MALADEQQIAVQRRLALRFVWACGVLGEQQMRVWQGARFAGRLLGRICWRDGMGRRAFGGDGFIDVRGWWGKTLRGCGDRKSLLTRWRVLPFACAGMRSE